MKKLIPVTAIIAMALISFASCKKKSDSCTCKGVGSSGNDTTASITNVDPSYPSLAVECDSLNVHLSATGSGYGCHM